MKWRIAAVVLTAVVAAACTEHLTTPGTCPSFCPGGQSVFRDTTLSPIPNGDSSFTGFIEQSNLTSLLTSSGGVYGENRAVIRFFPRTDSVLVSDTSRTFTVDSVALEVGLQARDTTTNNFVLEIYRLSPKLDSTASLADVDAQMTPANLIASVPEGVSAANGIVHITFSGDSLASLGFVPSDSTILEIGIRVRADSATAARIGTPASGAFAPLLTTYVEANGVVDSLKPQALGRIASDFFTISAPNPPPPATLLAVGGIPVSRSFIRFALPEYLRDSATIIRATLELHADAPVIGIPADTAQLVAGTELTDFGAKSPLIIGLTAAVPLLPGTQDVSLEIAPLIQAWQGKTPTPSVIRLSLAQEGGTFIFPLFRSTRAAVGAPTLRITYRPPFAFGGF
ncbi:MAG TPA: hypothetical protein VGM20_13375 [Gemmatimonadales bacterium]